MKRIAATASIVIMAVALQLTPAQAFNPAAHLHIAGKVFSNSHYMIDLHYGSFAPDIALYVDNLEAWPTSFVDTHYNYIALAPYAWSGRQRAFAKGWLTHNEIWGADYYAHIEYPVGNSPGYVIAKALLLSQQTGLDPEFAHYAIETAVDLLLKLDDPGVGEKLMKADLLRSWQDRNLLVTVLVWTERRTDWGTLLITEAAFRNLVGRYAAALSLPGPYDRAAMAHLGSLLAGEIYGIDVSADDVFMVLEAALDLCRDDYRLVIDAAIDGISDELQ